MGVKFKDIIEPEIINFKDLNGRIIAIDAANSLYQFLSSIRQADGTPLMDKNGNITSHLSGILYRTSNIVEKGIKPIYVFDGEPSEYKENTINERREIRQDAEKKWKEALKKGDEQTAMKFAKRSSRMSPYILESAKELLEIMGIPYVQSFGEGEAQASYMVLNGDAWAVASQDYDCLLFGAKKIIRNLTISGNLSDLEYLELDNVLNRLEITREQLVDIAIMVGTDFNPGIKGVGAKTGLKIVKNSSIEKYIKEKGITFDVNLEELKNIFLNPNINKNYNIKWKSVDKTKIVDFLCEKHDFSEERVLSAVKKMEKLNTTQKSLEDWFGK
ncbi:flap endonuclease [Methanobrevibacter arboriphilus JCM 13429 = DSM 1125]|uniref:Flap endonuclease 1 n=1 Tax=Methanobrevibacter arboriphilus JCM 13429 = DSM 1125 TaxID=1300164 RepID=A0A1V6N4Y1_METAZ|nr:flap endonuclease-1 [Methanobrevibacter arboriphilus]OQD59526.1 flap endonuclease [Methanobrevibacter arboriphilus JCM 13429 = DSM 1125]